MLIAKLARYYAGAERPPPREESRLLAMLEAAPSDALRLLVRHKVRHCWTVANRILRDRESRRKAE